MKPQQLVLAIDQGGHASRAFLVTPRGKQVYATFHEVDTSYVGDDQVEHDALHMLQSITACLQDVTSFVKSEHAQVLSAGLAAQRSSIVCWDRISGLALSPIISWQDRRNAAWMNTYASSNSSIHHHSGLYPSAHYGVSKLRWCLDHIPQVARARDEGRLAWGPMASYLLYHVLEQHPLLVDSVNASRTLLWGLAQKTWDSQLLQLFQFDSAALPVCVPNEYDFGHLRLGDQRVPFTVLTGDQPAALFAYGEPQANAAYVNMGTGAFVQRLYNGSVDYTPSLLTSVVHHKNDSILLALEGTVNGAGSAFVVVEQEEGMDPMLAQKELPLWMKRYPQPLFYLNGVSGLGSPYWQADFKSEFVGMGETPEKLVAVAHSIAFLISVNLLEMNRLLEAPDKIIVTGGLANIDPLCQLLADLNGRIVIRPAAEEASALGLACLLCGRPQEWPGITLYDEFKPVENLPLQQRFRQWQVLMKDRIASAN